jgi:L-lysine 2,3-aminomutase
MEKLRGHTTGYAIPQYVVDGPGGGGKIPLNPDYIVAQTNDRFILRNFKGDIYEYPDLQGEDADASLGGLVGAVSGYHSRFDLMTEGKD